MGPNPKDGEQERLKTARLTERLRRVRTIEDLLAVYRAGQWNYAVVGDGSGTRRQYAMGWGSVLFDQREPHVPRVIYGGSSYGTNNMAEMLSFAFSLMWISGDKNRPPGVIHVHLFTDSDYVARCATRDAAAGLIRRKKNRELWAMMDAFRRTGVVCHWHWVPRDCFDLNRFCHDAANVGRGAMIGLGDETVAQYDGKLQ